MSKLIQVESGLSSGQKDDVCQYKKCQNKQIKKGQAVISAHPNFIEEWRLHANCWNILRKKYNYKNRYI